MSFVLDREGTHLAALRRLADLRGQRVLEIGCGDGWLTQGIAADAGSVVAFDTNAVMVESAGKVLEAEVRRASVRFSVSSVVDLELPRSGFDVAVFSWSY